MAMPILLGGEASYIHSGRYFLDYLGLGMISAMLPFYVGYVLLRPDGGETSDTRDTVVTTGYIAVCVFIFAFLSVPVWESIARQLLRVMAAEVSETRGKRSFTKSSRSRTSARSWSMPSV